MSSPAAMVQGPIPWANPESQSSTMVANSGSTEDGVSVRPMRLKVLYTFDDQNKTNCLARWPHVLQIQAVAMDETTSIGVIELKTCIQAIVQCSPELVARLGQDYTVYAYDFSEYDNPLVGQGMLSWALAASSSTPDTPAHQSNKLITGRVCKNILGLFANGVKETLEVKLRLVPVPTVLQSEYINAMEKYRELSKVVPPGLDPNEWTTFLQSNPNFAQLANKATPTPSTHPTQRDGTSMELVNQLLSPSVEEQSLPTPPNQITATENIPHESIPESVNTEKSKKASRPLSRAAVKRPRKGRPPKNALAQGGNTSGYEEGTDGDDGPPNRKRAKITKADWSSKSTIGSTTDSLRVAASTAGSLRLFRPIAMSPMPTAGSHLQDIPRAPTPVPNMPNQHAARPRTASQSNLRADIFVSQIDAPQQHISPYPPLEKPEDQPRFSIESANNSPERNDTPADTPPGISSSPPVMRTRPPSPIRSSPPCPSSPMLPQMPRTDSGFMSGSLEDLFGEDNGGACAVDNDPTEVTPEFNRHPAPQTAPFFDSGFRIEEETPGPMELLPTRIPVHKPKQPPSKRTLSRHRSRAGSVMSEDGQQSLPPLRRDSKAAPSQLAIPQAGAQPESALQQPPTQQSSMAAAGSQTQSPAPNQPERQLSKARASTEQVPPAQTTQSTPAPAPAAKSGSRMVARTASMGALTFPEVPASEPAMPPSTLQRSQTCTNIPPAIEGSLPHLGMQQIPPFRPTDNSSEYSRACLEKKASIRQKLELAIANGQMPPFCNNCGAIETPTWRKAWSQDHQGAPGYHEYSDLPGKVTCINIVTRDSSGEPTSYQLIKKSLLPGENKEEYKEYLLCNPCGIWMTKYKTQRPKEKWESYAPATRKGIEGGNNGGRTQRSSKAKNAQSANLMMPTSEANFPPSDAYFPHSDGHFQTQEAYQPQRGTTGPPEGVSPTDTTGPMQQQSVVQSQAQAQDDRRRSTSSQPPKRLKAMTSDAASAALRRAIQSSPARWAETRKDSIDGTRRSPIDVEDNLGSTRRLLFPSPRKDGSPKVLGEVITNVVQIATDIHVLKGGEIQATNKENCPPTIEAGDMDAELLKLFDDEIERPTTPIQKPPVPNIFKTPTRPTPNHRPITRSVSKSIRSAKSPSQILSFGQQTPTKTPRRSPRNHDSIFESPFTATMNQLMSEAHNQSPTQDAMELDFGNISELPSLNANQGDINFNIDDFFSTDVPMPSSPPRMFHLYEDPGAMQNIDWNQFGGSGGHQKKTSGGGEVAIKLEPEDSLGKRGKTRNEKP